MKLSARNQIKGKVVEVRKGATTAHVRIDIADAAKRAAINRGVEEAQKALKKSLGDMFKR